MKGLIMVTCPQNHESETADYCSVCGIAISSAPVEPAVAPPKPVGSAGGGASCPECGTPRDTPQQAYCEVCGYNYRTGKAGVPPLGSPPPVPSPGPAPTAAPAPTLEESAVTGANVRWEVLVEVDPQLYGTPNPDAPVHQPLQTFTLYETESLVGRAGTEVRVHLPIQGDAGVSRRQAVLLRRPNGSLSVRDLGSANGTQLNGKDIVAGVETAVKDGDTIAIGAWTRLTLRAVPV
jgi:hypothetical protein